MSEPIFTTGIPKPSFDGTQAPSAFDATWFSIRATDPLSLQIEMAERAEKAERESKHGRRLARREKAHMGKIYARHMRNVA